MYGKDKIHTTNYTDTFIEVAEDCSVTEGKIPVQKGEKKSVAQQQYELIAGHPYEFTSDDVLFQVFADRNGIEQSDYEAARKEFFSKGQPCFRASPLTKTHGFGVHADQNGKIAIYGVESSTYRDFINNPEIRKVKAMRTSRK
ncbi:MAG: hypothetical protein ABS46_04765 [Cytophagaceae bacterium SCN 52-12]|nr:MAG: hypothetical protein ABS46_04765 [Cytophagaceae bacterium SCN 52-12]